MKICVKNIGETRKHFRIEIPADQVRNARMEFYQEIKNVAKVPGFRAGSVPQDLLEKHYAKEADEEVLKRLIPQGYRKALAGYKVIPVGLPEITNVSFEKGKPLAFEAEVDVRPSFRLRNYKAFKIKKRRISVLPSEIDGAFSRLQNMHASHNDVARPVKKSDYAVCDVEAFQDGQPISKKNTNLWILADKDLSMLGIGEELVGLVTGQTKKIDRELPKNYPDEKYRGKHATFKITVRGVKEKELPKLDDEFAKKLNIDSFETLKREIESQLYARKENSLKLDMENQILARLLEENKFSVPASLAKRQKEVFVKRLEHEFSQEGLSKQDRDKKIKDMDSDLDRDARSKVRIYFILDEIARKENIAATDSDVEDRIKDVALETGQDRDEVEKYYEKENIKEGLREEVKENKVLKFLLKHSIVEDVK